MNKKNSNRVILFDRKVKLFTFKITKKKSEINLKLIEKTKVSC